MAAISAAMPRITVQAIPSERKLRNPSCQCRERRPADCGRAGLSANHNLHGFGREAAGYFVHEAGVNWREAETQHDERKSSHQGVMGEAEQPGTRERQDRADCDESTVAPAINHEANADSTERNGGVERRGTKGSTLRRNASGDHEDGVRPKPGCHFHRNIDRENDGGEPTREGVRPRFGRFLAFA